MSAKLFGEIAKFFSGGKSGPKALLMAYAKFGKDAVNKYFKERQPSYNLKIDNKNIGGEMKKKTAQQKSLAASMEAGAKKQFRPTKKKTAQQKVMPPKVGKGGPAKIKQIGGKFYKMEGNKMVPIKGLDKKVLQGATFKNGGIVKKHHGGMVKRRAGVAKRGFNNFKGIF